MPWRVRNGIIADDLAFLLIHRRVLGARAVLPVPSCPRCRRSTPLQELLASCTRRTQDLIARLSSSFDTFDRPRDRGTARRPLSSRSGSTLPRVRTARSWRPPAVDRNGRRIAFSTRRNQETSLHVANVDGTGSRILTDAVQLQGAPVWSPNGESVTIASTIDGAPRLVNVPLDGGAPSPLVSQHSRDAVWSPDGAVLVYSGAHVGTMFPVER